MACTASEGKRSAKNYPGSSDRVPNIVYALMHAGRRQNAKSQRGDAWNWVWMFQKWTTLPLRAIPSNKRLSLQGFGSFLTAGWILVIQATNSSSQSPGGFKGAWSLQRWRGLWGGLKRASRVVADGMDCFATYFTHVQTCNVTRVQSATEWTASVHTLHMSKPAM